jgi:hypothetical protein
MKKYILIFKTSINTYDDKLMVKPLIEKMVDKNSWSVDLTDCDKVLRICADKDITEKIIRSVNVKGYACELLNY